MLASVCVFFCTNQVLSNSTTALWCGHYFLLPSSLHLGSFLQDLFPDEIFLDYVPFKEYRTDKYYRGGGKSNNNVKPSSQSQEDGGGKAPSTGPFSCGYPDCDAVSPHVLLCKVLLLLMVESTFKHSYTIITRPFVLCINNCMFSWVELESRLPELTIRNCWANHTYHGSYYKAGWNNSSSFDVTGFILLDMYGWSVHCMWLAKGSPIYLLQLESTWLESGQYMSLWYHW